MIMIAANSAIIYKFMMIKYNNEKQGGVGIDSTYEGMSKSVTMSVLMLVTLSFTFVILSAPIAIA